MESSVIVGLGLALTNDGFQSYSDIVACFSGCSSWVLKVEKLLSYVIFIYGASTPGQLVYQAFRNLLDKASLRVYGKPFQEYPGAEKFLQTLFYFTGINSLDLIWEYVKHKGLCMLMNNCAEDFFIQLINMKNSWCEVDPVNARDWDEERKLSVCEQLFNDSPLIMLSTVMLIIHIISNYANDPGDSPIPVCKLCARDTEFQLQQIPYFHQIDDDREMTPFLVGKSQGTVETPTSIAKGTRSTSKQSDQPSTPSFDCTSEGTSASSKSKTGKKTGKTTPSSGAKRPQRKSRSKEACNSTPRRKSNASGNSGGGGHQVVQAKCPTCSKIHVIKLPCPAPIYCHSKCSGSDCGETSAPIPKRNGPNCPDPAILKKKLLDLQQKHTQELMDLIKASMCKNCKESIETEIDQCTVDQSDLPFCNECGHNHKP